MERIGTPLILGLLIGALITGQTSSQAAGAQPLFCAEALSRPSAEMIRVQGLIDRPPTEVESLLPLIYRDTKLLNEVKQLRGAEKAQALKLYARQVLPKGERNKHLLMVVTDYALSLVIAINLAAQASGHPMAGPEMIAAIPPTLAIADLLSGFVHKYLDSWASSEGFLGGAVRAFRFHHESPSGMSDNTYLENTGDTATYLAPLFGLVAAAPLAGVHVDPVVGTSSLVLLLTLMNSQIFHAQAHLTTPSAFFAYLQKLRLSLRKDQHLLHHRPPFETDFAAINGWTSPPMRKVWPFLDLILWRATQKIQGQWIQDPRSIPTEVAEEIKKGLIEIPLELLLYTQAYEKRLPEDPELRQMILAAREAWRTEFANTRRANYIALSAADPELAQRLWREEQLDNPWIFGTSIVPLESGITVH